MSSVKRRQRSPLSSFRKIEAHFGQFNIIGNTVYMVFIYICFMEYRYLFSPIHFNCSDNQSIGLLCVCLLILSLANCFCSDGRLYSATPVDPVFILLPIFEQARMKVHLSFLVLHLKLIAKTITVILILQLIFIPGLWISFILRILLIILSNFVVEKTNANLQWCMGPITSLSSFSGFSVCSQGITIWRPSSFN